MSKLEIKIETTKGCKSKNNMDNLEKKYKELCQKQCEFTGIVSETREYVHELCDFNIDLYTDYSDGFYCFEVYVTIYVSNNERRVFRIDKVMNFLKKHGRITDENYRNLF